MQGCRLDSQRDGPQNPFFICNCGENCGGNITRRVVPGPFPDYEKTNNYVATVDPGSCTGCETCINNCWLKAITMGSEGVVEIKEEICVGCGQCTYQCPAEALTLKKRPESARYTPITTHPNARSINEYKADLEQYKDIIKPL